MTPIDSQNNITLRPTVGYYGALNRWDEMRSHRAQKPLHREKDRYFHHPFRPLYLTLHGVTEVLPVTL